MSEITARTKNALNQAIGYLTHIDEITPEHEQRILGQIERIKATRGKTKRK